MKNVTENVNDPTESNELNDEDLAEVSGGLISARWDVSTEKALQDDYAANGGGMFFDDYLLAKGVGELEKRARKQWVTNGASPSTMVVVSLVSGKYRVEFRNIDWQTSL